MPTCVPRAWLGSAKSRAGDDVTLWQRLLESPHDDVRFALLAELQKRIEGRDLEALALDPEGVRLLWASVLLNVHRGSRSKPLAVRQLLRRARKRPEELPRLLPLLSVALRSVRGPEWRAGLAAVVQLVEHRAEVEPLVHEAFPELQWV